MTMRVIEGARRERHCVWLCGQSLFFLLRLPPSFFASRGFAAQRERARALPLLNLKKISTSGPAMTVRLREESAL